MAASDAEDREDSKYNRDVTFLYCCSAPALDPTSYLDLVSLISTRPLYAYQTSHLLRLSLGKPILVVHLQFSSITMSSDAGLAVPLGTPRPGASRTSSSHSVQRSVERVDDRQDLGTVVRRGVSPAPDSAAEVGAGSAADERPTSIKLPVAQASSTGDLRSGLASPVIPDGAVQ